MGKLEGKIAFITGGDGGHQSRRAFVRADMDYGLKGPPHLRERREPRAPSTHLSCARFRLYGKAATQNNRSWLKAVQKLIGASMA
jgi:hypothetical protein